MSVIVCKLTGHLKFGWTHLNEAWFLIKSCFFPSWINLLPHSHPPLVCSIVGRKARALYACKAEHDSELSFIAGTIFENGESGSELTSRDEKREECGLVFVKKQTINMKRESRPWEVAGFIFRVGKKLLRDFVSCVVIVLEEGERRTGVVYWYFSLNP